MPEGSRRPRVLVVDDDPAVRQLLALSVGAAYEVTEARDGAEALAHLEHQPADLVLTDLEMPRLDGLALGQAMQARPALRRIPLVLVSSAPSASAAARAMGAVAWLAKPFRPQELAQVVQQYCPPPRAA